jgi:hypothetical protein
MRAVLYKASIDRLFKRMRFAQSVLTQQAVNTLKGPVKTSPSNPQYRSSQSLRRDGSRRHC